MAIDLAYDRLLKRKQNMVWEKPFHVLPNPPFNLTLMIVSHRVQFVIPTSVFGDEDARHSQFVRSTKRPYEPFTYSLSDSMLIQFRPSASAAAPVVLLPANGSSTRSPGLVR